MQDTEIEVSAEGLEVKAEADKGETRQAPRRREPRDTDNQRVFDHIIPRMLEQGRCWAPGYGNRYELARGYYWTGERYKHNVVLAEDVSTGRRFDGDHTVTKFAGDRVYSRCNYVRFDPIRMIFADRQAWSKLAWRPFYQDIFSENTTCDSGRICEFLERLGFQVSFLRAIQVVHDDLSLNPKEDWMKEFDRVSIRFGVERGTNRGDWLDLHERQEWNYHLPETEEAIQIAIRQERFRKV